jgi:hypothetical protein
MGAVRRRTTTNYTVPLCHFAVARAAPTPTAARDASASSSPLLYLYDASASIVLFCVCLFLWLKRTLVCWPVGQIARPDSGEVRPAPAWYACIFSFGFLCFRPVSANSWLSRRPSCRDTLQTMWHCSGFRSAILAGTS